MSDWTVGVEKAFLGDGTIAEYNIGLRTSTSTGWG